MDQAKDLYAKAFAELEGIDAKIADLERRRAVLRQFVDLGRKLYAAPDSYSGQPLASVVLHDPDVVARLNAAAGVTTTLREHTLKARVLALAKQVIQERGPQSTAELLTYLEAAGVEVTGAHKPTTVSVILSRSSEFVSDRKVGWMLAPAQKELTPQDAPTSAGSPPA